MEERFNEQAAVLHVKKKRGRKSKAEMASAEYQATKKKERDIEKLADTFIKDPTEYNFNMLCSRINWGLRSYIFKVVGSNEGIDAVMSKTLESIYYKRDQFDPSIAKFSTWMYKIAMNYAIKYTQETLNGPKNVQISTNFDDLYESTLMADADETAPLGAYSEDEEMNMYVGKDSEPIAYSREQILSDIYDASVRCIKELPENLQRVMTDRLINNKKISDIAEDNDIPVSSVKNWLRRGKSVLQDMVKEKYADLYLLYEESELAM